MIEQHYIKNLIKFLNLVIKTLTIQQKTTKTKINLTHIIVPKNSLFSSDAIVLINYSNGTSWLQILSNTFDILKVDSSLIKTIS